MRELNEETMPNAAIAHVSDVRPRLPTCSLRRWRTLRPFGRAAVTGGHEDALEVYEARIEALQTEGDRGPGRSRRRRKTPVGPTIPSYCRSQDIWCEPSNRAALGNGHHEPHKGGRTGRLIKK
jgi:hypothetical protein